MRDGIIIQCIGISTIYRPPARRAHVSESLRLGENHSILYDHFLVEPHGMMECWNIGHEKRKTDYHIKKCWIYSFWWCSQASIFWFFFGKIRHQNKKINQIIYVLNTGFFKSIIPRFQHSNCERSEFNSRMGRVNWLSCRHLMCFLTIVVLIDFVPSHWKCFNRFRKNNIDTLLVSY